MIPKIIHYCWFGGNPLTEEALKCIASWKKYCPDYSIVEWNESNFDVNSCAYVREAYEQKKWAFVSDYARFSILYHCGGVYFDTDVEILKPIDPIIEAGPFMGWEENGQSDIGPHVNPGLGLAFEKEDSICKEFLDKYHTIHFIDENGALNTLYNVVVIATEILEKHGLVRTESLQKIENLTIYPPEYFCPMNRFTGEVKITDHTYSNHLYSGSWLSKRVRAFDAFERKIRKQWIKKNAFFKLIKCLYCMGVKETVGIVLKKING